MGIELSLLGWSAKGLRCPDHDIDLSRSAVKRYRATLLQMPNGTGKTTTLELLRASLSGAAREWTEEHVRDFAKLSGAADKGRFVLKLTADGKPLTIELTLDFNSGKPKYRTTYGSSGIQNGFVPPRTLAPFFEPEFVNLYVFDGEFASALLDAKQTRARSAIDALFQLSLLGKLAKKFNENWEHHASSVSAKDDKGITRRRNAMDDLDKKLATLQAEKKRLKTSIGDLTGTHKALADEYDKRLVKKGDIGDRIEKVTAELNIAATKVEMLSGEVIAKMRDPHALSQIFQSRLRVLKHNLDKLKLPDSTSRAFFEELAKDSTCICGRPLDDQTRQAVLDRSTIYLAEDEFGILNSIKADIATYTDDADGTYAAGLEQSVTDLGAAVTNADALRTEREAAEAERLAQGDAELTELKTKRDAAYTALQEARDRLEVLERAPTGDDDDDVDCIKAVAQRAKEARERYAEVTQTVELRRKTERITALLSQIADQSRDEIRKVLIKDTNDRIKELLERTPVAVADIRDRLELSGQRGASVGQTLSVGYAFLSTLFNRAEHNLPFIVDSPAGSLDLRVRESVGELLPSLSRQCVAFTISSERASFVDALYDAAKHDVQFVTVFRKTSGSKATENKLKKLPAGSYSEFVDGFVVTDRDFFDAFDIKDEVA